MSHAPRPYQERAFTGVRGAWDAGKRAVCLVCPTGGGKTFMGSRLALERGGPVLWVAHRRELVKQAYAALHREVGGASLGIIAPGHEFERGARIQVGTVQTILARSPDVAPSVLVLDECHHYASEEWRELAGRWPGAVTLGLTATPERGDGRPLGDIFDSLVVAAQYSELISEGFLCEAVVFHPGEVLQGALANDPVKMWKRHSRGMRGFAFMPTVKAARELAERFTREGLPAACIDAKTAKSERDDRLARFAAGELQVLTNVDTLTEGVDVPAAGVCMLGRRFQTVGAYLQAGGRVLRPHESKEHAVIIDLTGASLVHSWPTVDRVYSLDGKGIRKESAENPVRNCLQCGLVYLCAEEACPDCGSRPPPRVARPQRIYSLELQEAWAGEHTADDAKAREYARLRIVARSKGLDVAWVVKEYRKLFGEAPRLSDVSADEKREQLVRFQRFGAARGFKPGFAAVRYKELFGAYPSR